MTHILVDILSQMTPLSDAEKSDIENSIPIKTFPKGTYLIREGKIAQNAYYVIKGCIREYELLNSQENTTAFYTENQSAINFQSISKQEPSKINFVCEEECTVAILNSEKEEALYKKYPRFETFCRTGMEEMMGTKQEELSEAIALKPEQRYEKLQRERPDLLNRVPQYHIASYLGISPETLSRIRRRVVKN